jgi:Na+-transporting NADH:ubiquinone oxidoreductase subunit A
MFTIKKGLDIPLSGQPAQSIFDGPVPSTVALVGDDYVGMKPTLAVREGDSVKLGQLLFTDKKNPDVRYTSPGAGIVRGVHRGKKRRFLSVEIELQGDDEQQFSACGLDYLTPEKAREKLNASGLWTALRTRPFNRVPDPQTSPRSIFVTAMDTAPLSADPTVILAENPDDFVLGLHVLTELTEGPVYVCHAPGAEIPGADVPRVTMESFAGPHPAGNPGTHIHFLDPVAMDRTVWFIGYQDVTAIGTLFRTGRLDVQRVIALAGPSVREPRLIRTRIGSNLDQLVAGQLLDGMRHRVISGSVLTGRKAEPCLAFLGRYHTQVSVLGEGGEREFLGWQMPGFKKFSVTRTFAAFWTSGNKLPLPLDTSTGGSRRAMVPIGVYERVVPLDVLPTQLLRALIIGDSEDAQALGCLELDEDDVALCTFVCPSKYEYGPLLRDVLTTIEREG